MLHRTDSTRKTQLHANPSSTAALSRAAAWGASACLGIAVIGSAICLTGCKDRESTERENDRKVQADLTRSAEERQKGGDLAESRALNALTDAAKEDNASLATRTRAMGSQAQAEFDRGLNALGELQQAELAVGQNIWRINQIGLQLRNINATIQYNKNCEPKGPRETIAKKRDEIKADNAKLDTRLAELKRDIDTRQGQIKDLTDQFNAAETAAKQLIEKSGSEEGKASVDDYSQAMQQREKAGKLQAQINLLNGPLIGVKPNTPGPLTLEYNSKLQQRKDAEDASNALAAQLKTIEDGWTLISQNTDTLEKSARTIITDQLGKASDELKEAVDNAAHVRDRAEESLSDAVNHFAAASALAEKLQQEVDKRVSDEHFKNSPETISWQQIASDLSASRYNLSKGQAQDALGTLYASFATELTHRLKLSQTLNPIVAATGAPLPEFLAAGSLSTDADAKKAKAIDYYKSAANAMVNITSGASAAEMADVVHSAQVQRMFSLYGRYLLTGDPVDLKSAQDARPKAGSGPLPILPTDLGGELKRMNVESGEVSGEAAAARTIASQFVDALARNEVDNARATFAQLPAEQDQALAQYAAAVQAGQKLKTLVQTKYKDTKDFSALGDLASEVHAAQVTTTATPDGQNTASLILGGDAQHPMRLLKVNNVWKINDLGLPGDPTTVIPAMIKIDNDLVDEINANTYPTYPDVVKTVNEKRTANGLPPLGPGAPAAPAPAAG